MSILLNILAKLKNNGNLILIVIVLGVFGYLIVSNNIMSKKLHLLNIANEQLKVNQEILINNSKPRISRQTLINKAMLRLIQKSPFCRRFTILGATFAGCGSTGTTGLVFCFFGSFHECDFC